MIQRLEVAGLKIVRGERVLFAGLTFALEAGEAMSVAGSNGSGKTSLLRAVAGGSPPIDGQIVFEGCDGPLDPETARSEDLHFLGHQDGLKTSRKAGDELEFWALWSGADKASIEAAVDRLSLKPLLNLTVGSLSAGQRRRLALARMAASPRSLWLMDEPLAPLDAGHRRGFGEMMASHLASGGLILAAIHDPLPIPSRTLVISSS
jgi:heme exporter protein A